MIQAFWDTLRPTPTVVKPTTLAEQMFWPLATVVVIAKRAFGYGGSLPERPGSAAKGERGVLKDASFASWCWDLEATSFQDVLLALRSRARLSRRDSDKETDVAGCGSFLAAESRGSAVCR